MKQSHNFLLPAIFLLSCGTSTGSSPLATSSANSQTPPSVICNQMDCSHLHNNKVNHSLLQVDLNRSQSIDIKINSKEKNYSQTVDFASKTNTQASSAPIVISNKNNSTKVNKANSSEINVEENLKEIHLNINTQIPFTSVPQVYLYNSSKVSLNVSRPGQVIPTDDNEFTRKSSPVSNLNKTGENVKENKQTHVDLNKLEHELEEKDPNSNRDLLLAISILQHHLVPESESSTENVKIGNKSYISQHIWNSSIFNESDHKLNKLSQSEKSKLQSSLSYSVEINDLYSPKNDLSEDFFRENQSFQIPLANNSENENDVSEEFEAPSQLHWFILVMDGDCSIIRNRMRAFVMFLKAALSAKLNANYEDIYVPSVFCDRTFMVNITIDTGKYPAASVKLQSLAEANTTLLEISGEIFYLERILVKKPDSKSNSYLRRHGDVEIVIYIGLGCMGFFILLSLLTAFLVRICRQDEDILMEKRECDERPDYISRRPKVIYSPSFSQGIDIEKTLSKRNEQFSESQGSSVAPSSSSNAFGTYIRHCSSRERDSVHSEGHCERKSFIGSSSSRLKLLEEVQEEDEEDLVDEYQEHNEDTEAENEEDIEEMEYEDVDNCEGMNEDHLLSSEMDDTCVDLDTGAQHYSSVDLEDSLRPFYLTSSGDASSNPLSFDNPCYKR